MTDPRTEYHTRLQVRRASLVVQERRHQTLGNIRIAVFLAAIAMFFAAFIGQRLSGWWLFVPVGVLVVVGRRLEQLEEQVARLLRATAFYERGLARLDHRWAGSGSDGGRFLDEGHLYAADVDIVGPGSLFQMLSVARTERGIETLAAWLLNRAALDTIARRQNAVREMAIRLDLREDLAIAGDRAPADGSADALVAWGERPVRSYTLSERALSWMISVLGLGAAIAGVTYLLGSFGLFTFTDQTMNRLQNYFVVVASLCFVTHWTAKKWTEPIVEQVFRAEHDLGLLADVLERIEREAFTSPYLTTLHAALVADGVPASSRIATLKALASLLGARRNELMKVIGPLLLWDVHVSRAIEDWRRVSGTAIDRWLRAVGEFEAVASLAGFAWERPDNVYPEFIEGAPLFEADNLSHPLLPPDRAVANTVHLNADVRVLVVSGSNMSGKSTLLRTIGVNAVLAQAGSPVCATRLRLSPLVVGASIRIQDSLQEGTSRFYAEISRLSRIMESSLGAVPVLFLIDEFLHGTNSHDRLIGAEAVVRGLADRGAIGLITTHDLALTRLVETLGSRADNVHFQDYLENGRMRFDYHMRPGVVQHSNALALMRSVGLDV